MLFLVVFLSVFWPLVSCIPSSAMSGIHSSITKPKAHWVGFEMLAQFDFKPFQLSNLGLDCTRESTDEMYQCTFSFHWEDMNFNTSSYCKNDWAWDGVTMESGPNNGYNTDYFLCSENLPESWEFEFMSMTNPGNFTLILAHQCKDVIHFKPNTEIANFFAESNFTMVPITGTETEIRYAGVGPFNATINGLTI